MVVVIFVIVAVLLLTTLVLISTRFRRVIFRRVTVPLEGDVPARLTGEDERPEP